MLNPDFNYTSREWGFVLTMLEEDLAKAVDQLCNLECEPTRTEQLRGRIHYIKDILAGAKAAARERLR